MKVYAIISSYPFLACLNTEDNFEGIFKLAQLAFGNRLFNIKQFATKHL